MIDTFSIHSADSADLDPTGAGGTWLLDLVAAVDHLGRGARPHLTVWDAISEAVLWTRPDIDDDTASFVIALGGLLTEHPDTAAVVLQTAIRRWVLAMAHRYNDGHHWPHPTARRSFPPPLIETASQESASGTRSPASS